MHPLSEPPEAGAGGAPLRLPSNTNLSHPQGAPEGLEPDDAQHLDGCPNSGGWYFLSASTGSVVPARCTRNHCGYCVVINAHRRARAIAFARPERAILLTQVGDTWATVQARINRLRHAITKATGERSEWVWHVEPNPQGTGHHVHAWQHGPYVDQSMLSRLAAREGMGSFARINRIRTATGAARYGLKGLGYGLKTVRDGDGTAPATYLRANGRRLTHQSRGFFRDARGEKIAVRAAEQAASAQSRTDQGPWQLIRC